jgi:branched-chain amino acid transport system permease protein
MSSAWQFYLITLLVYYGVNLISCWALNLQYGVAGVMNFGFIVFQAIGAYAGAVLTLGPSSASGYQSYIAGMTLPWPVPLLVAGVLGALLALIVGWVVLKPVRRDFQALLMLVFSIIATTVVSSETGWFNGAAGLAAVPQPFAGSVGGSSLGYGWFYVGLTAAVCAATYVVIHRLTAAPWARRLRAVRENPASASALGINVHREQLTVFVVGGALAAVSGALLVQFVGSWAPSGWQYSETFLYFTAIVVGGLANNAGAGLGAAVVFAGILETPRFLPKFGTVGGLADALEPMSVGILILAFLWFRPQGLVPERRRRPGRRRSVVRMPGLGVVTSRNSK